MINKIKTAIIGCGKISEVYLKNISSRFSILELVACCDSVAELQQKTAEEYGIRGMSLEEIIADEEIALVINLTPPGVHYSIIKQLLEGGKNVYTEKALALTYEDANELVELAERKELYLGASPDTFLGAQIQTARQLIESGFIGKVKSCHAFVNRDYKILREYIPYISKAGGGIGVDVGIYYLTALISILGPVVEVAGYCRMEEGVQNHMFPRIGNYGENYTIECETIMTGMLLFASNVIATLHFNSESIFPEQPSLVFYGTEGILSIENPDKFGGCVKVLKKGQDEWLDMPLNFGYADESRGIGAAEMAWSMLRNRKHRANAEMATHAVEILQGIQRSSKSGEYYRLKSDFEKLPGLKEGYLGEGYVGSDGEGALD